MNDDTQISRRNKHNGARDETPAHKTMLRSLARITRPEAPNRAPEMIGNLELSMRMQENVYLLQVGVRPIAMFHLRDRDVMAMFRMIEAANAEVRTLPRFNVHVSLRVGHRGRFVTLLYNDHGIGRVDALFALLSKSPRDKRAIGRLLGYHEDILPGVGK